MSRVVAMLRRVSGSSILDVGCAGHVVEPGSDEWLHGRLRKEFPEADVVGIDLSEDNVAQMRRLGLENVSAANAETFELGRTFDTIIAGELIEHLSNPGLFLASCHRHLNGGGRLVLSTPYPFSVHYGLRAVLRYPDTCSNHEHTMWLCPTTVTELARREGFELEELELIGWYRYDEESRPYALFVRLLRLARPFLPKRLYANTMILVFRKADS